MKRQNNNLDKITREGKKSLSALSGSLQTDTPSDHCLVAHGTPVRWQEGGDTGWYAHFYKMMG